LSRIIKPATLKIGLQVNDTEHLIPQTVLLFRHTFIMESLTEAKTGGFKSPNFLYRVGPIRSSASFHHAAPSGQVSNGPGGLRNGPAAATGRILQEFCHTFPWAPKRGFQAFWPLPPTPDRLLADGAETRAS
jgi:hypothetical protein